LPNSILPFLLNLISAISEQNSDLRNLFLPQIFPQLPNWLSETENSDLQRSTAFLTLAFSMTSGFDNFEEFPEFVIRFFVENFRRMF
jgi:hypothetical protein